MSGKEMKGGVNFFSFKLKIGVELAEHSNWTFYSNVAILSLKLEAHFVQLSQLAIQ